MKQDGALDTSTDPKRAMIHAAAIAEFSARGYAATSMANIADAAGMSRPALYQYFRNKGDIFASAFVALFEGHADRAQSALDEPGDVAAQLDGFLQRFEGDLWERMAASPHSDEIMSAKTVVSDEIHHVVERRLDGLSAFLAKVSPGRKAADVERRRAWAEVIELSPKGLKFDQPSVETYRDRLTTLARGVASDIERG